MNLFIYILKLLSFQLKRDEMLHFNKYHLLFGIIGTWVVGIGRYWDDTTASLFQHLGMVSVIYIFVLAAFLWLIVLPFKIEKWTYINVLTFVSLTSFPAIFYAIPVEQYVPIEQANSINVWFLAIVAAWRLALLYYFLREFTKLGNSNILTVTFMPMCLIISVLTMLNLHNVVFQIMGGIRNPTPHDGSYMVLLFLTGISMILSIPLLVSYGIGIYKRRIKLNEEID